MESWPLQSCSEKIGSGVIEAQASWRYTPLNKAFLVSMHVVVFL